MNIEELQIRLRNFSELLTPMEMELAERCIADLRQRFLQVQANSQGIIEELRQTRATLTKMHDNAELVAKQNLDLQAENEKLSRFLQDEMNRRHNIARSLEEETQRRIETGTVLAQFKLQCAALKAENAELNKRVQLVDFTVECAELKTDNENLETLDADLRAARTQISELQFALKELRDRANFLADKLKESRGGVEFYQKLANQHAATAHSIHERYVKLQEKLARVRDTLDSKLS